MECPMNGSRSNHHRQRVDGVDRHLLEELEVRPFLKQCSEWDPFLGVGETQCNLPPFP